MLGLEVKTAIRVYLLIVVCLFSSILPKMVGLFDWILKVFIFSTVYYSQIIILITALVPRISVILKLEFLFSATIIDL